MTNPRSLPADLTIAALCAMLTTGCTSATGSAASATTASTASTAATAHTAHTAHTASASATCTPAQLTVKADAATAATGHSELVIAITNQGTTTCTLSGFPKVVGTLTSGTAVQATYTAHVFIGMANPGTAPRPVTLAPGANAWLPLNFVDNPVNGATSCPSFASFSISPPGVNRAYTVQASTAGAAAPPDCNGLYVPPVLSTADAVIPSNS